MYKILEKRALNPEVSLMTVFAPMAARRAKPGQFIILRIDDDGERIPLTIADFDPENGTVTVIYQKVGASTKLLDLKNTGDTLSDFVGPLGKPSELEGIKRACVIGGGLGVAIAYPQAKALKKLGAEVDLIVGFRNESLIILKDELENACDRLTIMTDDGSNGHKGFVTDPLAKFLEDGKKYDEVIAIGPLPMMKAVCNATKKYDVKTTGSMNSIMIDGTGMCGGCRVQIGTETKFACVDGPEFDGHLVDFNVLRTRQGMYREMEAEAEKEHKCRIGRGGNKKCLCH